MRALLGAWRLVQRRACTGLFAAAAGAIWFNWYTGYMVCLLCVLYFLYELARRNELCGRRLRRCMRFATTMALAVGAGIAVLLPTALSLLGGKGAHAGLSAILEGDLFARNPLSVPDLFCIGTTPGITTQANRPAMVISAFALVGAGTFFANKAIAVRDRMAGGVFAGFMLASLVLPALTTIWAGFVPKARTPTATGSPSCWCWSCWQPKACLRCAACLREPSACARSSRRRHRASRLCRIRGVSTVREACTAAERRACHP